MLRRSLTILSAFTILALALTVGYAAFGLSGPETVIREAEEELAAGRPQNAIARLSLVERSLGGAGEEPLVRRMCEVRARAHLAMHSYRHALPALELLVDQYAPGERELELLLIETLVDNGDSQAALRRARQLLESEPGDPRVLELAGSALYQQFTTQFDELVAELEIGLPRALVGEAKATLAPYLYRHPHGLIGNRAKADFDALIARHQHGASASLYDAPIQRMLPAIRGAIDFYRQSIAAGGEPTTAYRDLARITLAAGRADDALALAQAYLRRFEGATAIRAALDAARIHAHAGRDRRAAAIATRFLRSDAWRPHLSDETTAELRALALTAGRALDRLADGAELLALVETIDGIEQHLVEVADDADAPADMAPEAGLVRGYAALHAGDGERAEELTGPLHFHANADRQPATGESLIGEIMRLRLRAWRQSGRGPGQYRWICEQWRQLAPDDPEPLRLSVASALQHNNVVLNDAVQLRSLAPHDDEALRLYAAAVDAARAGSGRDSNALFKQAVQLRGQLPRHLGEPALLLPVAERALAEDQPGIAAEAARRAAQEYPWAVQPRRLWAAAAHALGNTAEASRVLDTLVTFHPDRPDLLPALVEARQRADQPIDDLLYELAIGAPASAELATALLRRCIARRDWISARRFAIRLAPLFADSPDVLAATADALSLGGNTWLAKRLLLPMFRGIFDADPQQAAPVARRYLVLAAQSRDFATVRAIADSTIELLRDDPAQLVEIAEQLIAAHAPAPAYDALQHVLQDPAHTGARDGTVHLLAGRAALAMGRIEDAEHALTAALTFADGRAASRLLTLLMLDQGRATEAASAYLEEAATDPTSAAIMLRLGRAAEAGRWVDATLRADLANWKALCLAAVLRPNKKTSSPIGELVEAAPELLVDVIAYAGESGFEQIGLQRAKQLRQRFPDNSLARLAHAHALSQAGNDEAALAQLAQLVQHDSAVAALDELVRVLAEHDPEQLTSPEMVQRVAQVVRANPGLCTPRLMAQGLRNAAQLLAGADQPTPAAAATLATLWTRFPVETGAGVAEVETLARLGHGEAAVELLDALDRRVPATERGAFATAVGHLCQEWTTTASPGIRRQLDRRLRRMIERDGAYGALVHAVLDHSAAASAPTPAERDEQIALLEAHLRLFESESDPDSGAVARTIRRLAVLEGHEETLERIDPMLRDDPSLVDVWQLRATLLSQSGLYDQALRSLRWLVPIYDSDSLVFDYYYLMATRGVVADDAVTALAQRLGERADSTPFSAVVRGILHLRLGEAERAAAILDGTEAGGDDRIYYAALAHLAVPDPEAAERAAAYFEQLAVSGRGNPSAIASEIASLLRGARSAGL